MQCVIKFSCGLGGARGVCTPEPRLNNLKGNWSTFSKVPYPYGTLDGTLDAYQKHGGEGYRSNS